jgi:uncharacterized membrane protein YjfL (UPF0719 family)
MSEHLLTYALPAFISHFISSIILLLLFVTIYIRITPYKEITLIRSGNMPPPVYPVQYLVIASPSLQQLPIV